MIEATWPSGSPNIFVLLCYVCVVYHCNCCVPRVYQCSVLPFCIHLSSYHCVFRMLQCLCCVQYSIFCIYCTLLCCTTNQCASHSISPHHPHNTCYTTGCDTTVGWLLIMTTVGKTHAVKYTKEATLTKTIHYLITAWNRVGVNKIIIKVTKKFRTSQPRATLEKKSYNLDFLATRKKPEMLHSVMYEQTNSKNSPESFSSSWPSVHQLRNTWVGGWANLLEHVV